MNFLPELDNNGKIQEKIEEHKKEIVRLKKDLKKRLKQRKPKEEKKSAQSKITIGMGASCHKCGKTMVRKAHKVPPLKFHYVKWDVCTCGVVKHYEEFKCEEWKEYERQQDFIRNI